jgi:hypothetical protein
MPEKKSKISNTEWGLVIAALVMVDLTQMVLEWFIIGLALNPVIIDPFIGMSFAFYLYIRGEKMTDTKHVLGWFGTYIMELIPGVDELPLWSLYGIYVMLLSKSQNILKTDNKGVTPKAPQ